MRTNNVVVTAALLAVISGAAGAQNLVTNGDFEDGNLTGWTTTGSPQVFAGFGVGSSFAAVFTGAGPAFNIISQAVSTTVGQTYTLDYQLASNKIGTSPFGTGAPTVTDEFVTVLDTTTELDLTNSLTTPFTDHSLQFVAANASTLLTFKGFFASGYYSLDNVSVTLKSSPVTTTPEPGSLALMASFAVTGGVFLRRRRNA